MTEETQIKETKQEEKFVDIKFIITIVLLGVLFLAGGVAVGYVGKDKWIEQGKNETLSNLTLMSEVGNAYIIALANQYNGTIPIVVRNEQLNETQVYTCSNITRIK